MTPLEIAAAAVRLYAETHPRPLHVTRTQAAEMLGISAPTLRKLLDRRRVKANACGLLPISVIDRLLVDE